MIRLPVSALEVQLRLPDGADEIALAEGDPAVVPTALRLLGRLAVRQDGAAADWSLLPVTDFEILLLRLRQLLLGPAIASHVGCPTCRERVEVSFHINDYIAAVRPVVPSELTIAPVSGPTEGWLTLGGAVFRLPLVADLLAVRQARQPGAALRARCLAPDTSTKLRRRIEGVIERAAPPVSGPVGGACPACGTTLQALFDVAGFVVAELRRLAVGVYSEVHLLATTYGWTEAAILTLPGARRRHYAELVRSDARRHAFAA